MRGVSVSSANAATLTSAVQSLKAQQTSVVEKAYYRRYLEEDFSPGEDVNYEFTDWMALQSFVDDFLASCVPSNAEIEIATLRPARLLH